MPVQSFGQVSFLVEGKITPTGRGKSGGARVIYYWANNENQIFMLFAYPKNEMENITKEQLSVLKKAVETEFKNGK